MTAANDVLATTEARADAAVLQVLEEIDRALDAALAIYQRQGVTAGPGMYFDFCAIAMRKARKNVLSDPKLFAGNLVRARHCLKEAVKPAPRGNRPANQDILDSANAVNTAIDTALSEIQSVRKELRKGTV